MNADVGAFLKKDVASFFNKKRKIKTKESQRIALNRSFLTGFIVVILVSGFYGGYAYGNQVKQYAVEIFNTRISHLPFLSDFYYPANIPTGELIPEDAIETIVNPTETYLPVVSQEQAVINVVKQASPAVVSIIITKELPVYETYYEIYRDPFNEFFGGGVDVQVPRQRESGTEEKRIGGGTGFIVSTDGLVLTNKHVVLDKDAIYTVITNEGNSYPAVVLARDPFQDLAVLKIEPSSNVNTNGQVISDLFPVVELGDSSGIQIGQTVVAIGYALGEFRNTVSVGVISGQGRTITATDGGGMSETLTDILQTDTAINRGNSGGPLLNLNVEVIGINVAVAEGAQSIGFAIPSNKASKDINDVKLYNKIVYAFLGVRHIEITKALKEAENLPVDYGSLIAEGTKEEPGIAVGSGADKAGLKSGDIILELNGTRIDSDNSLGDLLQKYRPGDIITLKILRDGEELIKPALLGEITSEE